MHCSASPHPITVVAPNQASSASLCNRSRLWAIHTTANLPFRCQIALRVLLQRQARARVPRQHIRAQDATSSHEDHVSRWHVRLVCGYRHVNRASQDYQAASHAPEAQTAPLVRGGSHPGLRRCDGAKSSIRGHRERDRGPSAARARRTGRLDVRRNDEAPHQHHH